MMQTLIVHGRQPALGRAELEILYGADVLEPVGNDATLINLDPTSIDFMRLGGMVKFCKVLTFLETTNWNEIEKFLVNETPNHFQYLESGKLKIGLSVYGLDTNPRRMHATALKLKKAGKEVGRSIRIIPNEKLDLNSAQVLYNKLTQKLGWELVFVKHGHKTIVAQSIAVQDIDRYAARDQERPYRDARVGMLPPKLAQIIINLAVGGSDDPKDPLCLPNGQGEPKDLTVIDPFCGTGVILQEATLMNYRAYGTDLEPRMVEYSEKNLNWLKNKYEDWQIQFNVEQADATSHTWERSLTSKSVIACETYLGRALTSLPDQETLAKIINDCDTIHKKFLKNVARQTKPGFRMCLAVPTWHTKNGFRHLRTLDSLEKMGYNRVKFKFSSNNDLIYHRPGQTVARELVVLERL
ncbi:methyltransferase domain-containing protein [Candidatus Saccharibacteria bacterium]|nr:methyltransferase domain-containing protein [Candidatus Saccharibacteria bacterium]